jgi:hypothetical protein
MDLATQVDRRLDHRSRAKRWRDVVSELTTLQGHYAAWLEALPKNLQDSATAEALLARSATSTSLNSRQSFRRAASAEIDLRNVRSPHAHSSRATKGDSLDADRGSRLRAD